MAWLGTGTVHSECGKQFRTRHLSGFGSGERCSWGPVSWRSGLLAICWTSRRSVGQGISCSLRLYWELGSPHTAAVRRPAALQTRLVLPQATMIAGWIHWLGVFRCWAWGFSTRLPKGYRFGHMVNWSPVPDRSHGQWASLVQESLPYLCWIRPHSPCISRGYDLHDQ